MVSSTNVEFPAPPLKAFFLDGIEAASVVEISSGTVLAESVITKGNYGRRAFIPQGPWSKADTALTDRLTTTSGQRPRCGLFSLNREGILIADALRKRNPLGDVAKSEMAELVAYCSERFSAREVQVHGGVWLEPGFETVSFNEKTSSYLGLHVDSWDTTDFSKRFDTRTRICINLGPDVRSFLYLPISLQDMARLVADRHEQGSTYSLVGRFCELYPRVPIIRLNMPPGMGYLADTDNLVHDGSSSLARTRSLHCTFRAKIKLGYGLD